MYYTQETMCKTNAKAVLSWAKTGALSDAESMQTRFHSCALPRVTCSSSLINTPEISKSLNLSLASRQLCTSQYCELGELTVLILRSIQALKGPSNLHSELIVQVARLAAERCCSYLKSWQRQSLLSRHMPPFSPNSSSIEELYHACLAFSPDLLGVGQLRYMLAMTLLTTATLIHTHPCQDDERQCTADC